MPKHPLYCSQCSLAKRSAKLSQAMNFAIKCFEIGKELQQILSSRNILKIHFFKWSLISIKMT